MSENQLKLSYASNSHVQAPVTSLTVRPIRHPQAPLVGSLRASRSGSAYLER